MNGKHFIISLIPKYLQDHLRLPGCADIGQHKVQISALTKYAGKRRQIPQGKQKKIGISVMTPESKFEPGMNQSNATPQEVTRLLMEWQNGNQAALNDLMPLVYDELRRLAAYFLQRERSDHTLQPTALVHEAYMRLIDQHSISWQNRAHFFALAAQMMRRILINHAEARQAAKRGGGAGKIPLDEVTCTFGNSDVKLMALNDALSHLATFDPLKSQIVELRFFGGLTVDEVAGVIGKSTATIEREWSLARAWLYRETCMG